MEIRSCEYGICRPQMGFLNGAMGINRINSIGLFFRENKLLDNNYLPDCLSVEFYDNMIKARWV